MASGILDGKGIPFYKDEGINIYYKDGLLTKRELGKADIDIAIDKTTKFSWVLKIADEWIKTYESCL